MVYSTIHLFRFLIILKPFPPPILLSSFLDTKVKTMRERYRRSSTPATLRAARFLEVPLQCPCLQNPAALYVHVVTFPSFSHKKNNPTVMFLIPCFFHVTIHPGNHSALVHRDHFLKQLHSLRCMSAPKAFAASRVEAPITGNDGITHQCVHVGLLEACSQAQFLGMGLLGQGTCTKFVSSDHISLHGRVAPPCPPTGNV